MVLATLMEDFKMYGLKINEPKLLICKVLIIFVPIFLMAHFTHSMAYVLPTLAISMMFGSGINLGDADEDKDS